MFGKFIFPRTSCEQGENDEPTANYWQLRENSWDIEKSSCESGREQKFRRTPYPLSCEQPLCSLKKPTGDGSRQTVCEPSTN